MAIELPRPRVHVGLLVVGDKGFHFLSDICSWASVAHVVTYEQVTSSFTLDTFARLARDLGASFEVAKHPKLDFAAHVDVVFVVGWQYLLKDPPPNLVVLHDSLLPNRRGFAPTVSALLSGDTNLGVSAVLPGTGVDDGPLLAQSSVRISSPTKIAVAIESLRACYLSVARQICDALASGGSLAALSQPQSEALATYSQWRDEWDYLVDWSLSAEAVVRHIHAVGPPYSGAIAYSATGLKIVLEDAELGNDVTFVNRTPGKVYAVTPRYFDIVCGSGMLRITKWRSSVSWSPKLRTRFMNLSVASLLLIQEHGDRSC